MDAHKPGAPLKKWLDEIIPNCVESIDRILANAEELGSAKG